MAVCEERRSDDSRSGDRSRSRGRSRRRDSSKDRRSKREGRRGEGDDVVRAVLRRRRSRSRSYGSRRNEGRSRSPQRDAPRASLKAREREPENRDSSRGPFNGERRMGPGSGGRDFLMKPLPRPGQDTDPRLSRRKDDDPRYAEGAQLGKAQKAAMGIKGLQGRNTASFDPKSTLVRPAMRVFYGAPGAKRYEDRLRLDDVLIVPDFACSETDTQTYEELVAELKGLGEEAVLADAPACRQIVKRACKYLSVDLEAAGVRLSWYKKLGNAEPLVREFGKVKSRPSSKQNCAVSISFGTERETAFRKAGSEELLFFPRTNGALCFMGKEVWLRWNSGMNTYASEKDQGRSSGHFCIDIFGHSEQAESDTTLGEPVTDAKLGVPGTQGQMDCPVGDRPRPDMRVITVAKRKKYGQEVRHDDVIIVPEFFCKEDDWELYYTLIREMRESQEKGTNRSEWISWHEGAHLLSQNPTGSKTFQKVLDQMCDYFAVAEGNRGTRFNWYTTGADWKPFHHDSAAFNAQRAKSQNCTIGISFGDSRELAFRHAKTGELIYFPQKNGMLFYFGQDANIVWQHGINALPDNEQDGKGRISIILWGLCTATIDQPGSPPMLTDENRDGGKGKGKGKGWGYDGRAKQPCRDFQKGRCSYGDRCRFSHE